MNNIRKICAGGIIALMVLVTSLVIYRGAIQPKLNLYHRYNYGDYVVNRLDHRPGQINAVYLRKDKVPYYRVCYSCSIGYGELYCDEGDMMPMKTP